MVSSPLSALIPRETSPEGRRDQTINIVLSRFQISESYHSGIRKRLPRWYDLWRGTWTSVYHPHKNNVHIPLIYSAIWSDAARKAATSLAQFPICNFVGYGEDDQLIARKQESLTSAQCEDDNFFLKQVNILTSADLYGLAVEMQGWKRTEEFRVLEAIDVNPITKETIRTIKKGNVLTFDGPHSENLDLLDCYFQPGIATKENMKWFIRRSFIDTDDCAALVAAGVFSAAEWQRMQREGYASPAAGNAAAVQRFSTRLGMDDDSARWLDKYNTPIELLEMWGYIPKHLSPDGDRFRVITLANRRYLFRNKPNPHWHGQLPIQLFSPTPDMHYLFAPGKAEVIEKLQIAGNRFVNQVLDASELVIDPIWFYDRAANVNLRNTVMRPGKFIGVDGNPSQVLSPLSANLNQILMGDQRVSQMREFAQMGTGLGEDTIMGLGGLDGRQTAREFQGRREAATNRLALEGRIYEKMMLEQHFDVMAAMNRQFLSPPAEVTMLGPDSMEDQVSGRPSPVTKMTITDADLMRTYRARAVGASSVLSKSMRQQNMIQLLTSLSTPLGQAVYGNINAVNFWRSIFRDFDVPNIEEIFKDNEELSSLVENTGMGGLGAIPTSGQIVNGAQPDPSGGALGLPSMPYGEEPGGENTVLPPQL